MTARTLLIRNIHTLVTMDGERRELRNAAMLVRGAIIERIGPSDELPPKADEVLDLKGRHIVLPGLINTHHHFYQTLTRAVPGAQSCELFDWLKTLYPLWSRLTADGVRASAQLAAAELMLSGCTSSSDHLYLYPNDCTLDEEIRAVAELGLRFHASRGSMSVGESQGGLPPDNLVEKEETILKDCQRLIETHHDNKRHAMTRIVIAPCSPFSVSPDLMRESAALARTHPGVRLHTHLAESVRDVQYSVGRLGVTPGDYAESLGWVGEDVWHAHCVHLDTLTMKRFASTGTGVAHCPSSNMRLGSGIAPIRKMIELGIAVGIGVDGAASNDGSNLLHETRLACLLARVGESDPGAMAPRTALELATRGGARVLGRDDIGYLAPGMSADFIALNIDRAHFAGAQWDLVAALILCQPERVDYSFINGRGVVQDGRLVTAELETLVERVQRAAEAMALGAH
ncbi:MAG: 8-oxoguanine deaminase [Steroidobacteraceae bacterium]|jgi:8-oxoguanine deaminase